MSGRRKGVKIMGSECETNHGDSDWGMCGGGGERNQSTSDGGRVIKNNFSVVAKNDIILA